MNHQDLIRLLKVKLQQILKIMIKCENIQDTKIEESHTSQFRQTMNVNKLRKVKNNLQRQMFLSHQQP